MNRKEYSYMAVIAKGSHFFDFSFFERNPYKLYIVRTVETNSLQKDKRKTI